MASLRGVTLPLMLLIGAWLLFAVGHDIHESHHDLHVRELQANSSAEVSFWAPYHRNFSIGKAWVVPHTYDLGARGMNCECFNPAETCCMAKTSGAAPFCIPKDSSCCSDTACEVGESCCGNACCPAETSCSITNGAPVCCPNGKFCAGPAICHDHAAPNCSATLFPLPGCCPIGAPYCHEPSLSGVGCFASSLVVKAALNAGAGSRSSGTIPDSEPTTTTSTTLTSNILVTNIETITLELSTSSASDFKPLASNSAFELVTSLVSSPASQSATSTSITQAITMINPKTLTLNSPTSAESALVLASSTSAPEPAAISNLSEDSQESISTTTPTGDITTTIISTLTLFSVTPIDSPTPSTFPLHPFITSAVPGVLSSTTETSPLDEEENSTTSIISITTTLPINTVVVATTTVSVPTSPSAINSTIPSNSILASPSTHHAKSTSPSPLCFNPTLQAPATCPSPPSHINSQRPTEFILSSKGDHLYVGLGLVFLGALLVVILVLGGYVIAEVW